MKFIIVYVNPYYAEFLKWNNPPARMCRLVWLYTGTFGVSRIRVNNHPDTEVILTNKNFSVSLSARIITDLLIFILNLTRFLANV